MIREQLAVGPQNYSVPSGPFVGQQQNLVLQGSVSGPTFGFLGLRSHSVFQLILPSQQAV